LNIKRSFDIDLDFADRTAALATIEHSPASILRDGKLVKHNSGVYVNPVPVDPLSGQCSLDYQTAEELGYIKLDFLNVSLYQQIKDEAQLNALIAQEPDWTKLNDRAFVEQLIHIGNHYDLLQQMPEPVNSITRMAMFLAIIRPAKRHLARLLWKEVAKTVWEKEVDGSYGFKCSHAIAYSHLVVVHMNLLSNLSD
jgi:hypothetical protein